MAYIINNEDVEAVKTAILSQCLDRYIHGNDSISSKFERSFAKKMQSKKALAVSSGTGALICALKGMNIGCNDEVIVPAYTYIATVLAVMAVGAKPIIVDIDESLTIDPLEVASKITTKTKVIIPVHMRGLPCNMGAIQDLARKHKLLILEDVAQACGGSYKGKRLGTIGDAGIFSFNHYKILTCGEGGALITNNKDIYTRAKLYHHGGYVFDSKNNHELTTNNIAGVNYRISEISSAMMIVQLKRLDHILTALRAEKLIVLNELSVVENIMQQCFINDVAGDCGTGVFYIMPTEENATDFVTLANENNIEAFTGITPGHNYHDWVPILNSNEYTLENFSKSKSILSRVVGIPTKANRKYDELSNTLQKIISITRSL